MHYKQTAKKLCVMLTVLLTGLALKGCGDIDSGSSSAPSTSLKIAVVYNPSQAAQLTQREADIATMRVDVSGPGFAPMTASAPFNPSSKQVDVSINAAAWQRSHHLSRRAGCRQSVAFLRQCQRRDDPGKRTDPYHRRPAVSRPDQ